MSEPRLSALDRAILTAIEADPANACGNPVRTAAGALLGREIVIATFYQRTDALEDAGWITRETRAGGPTRGNRPRAFFVLAKPLTDDLRLDAIAACEARWNDRFRRAIVRDILTGGTFLTLIGLIAFRNGWVGLALGGGFALFVYILGRRLLPEVWQ